MNYRIFPCTCISPDHAIHIYVDPEDDMETIWIEIKLDPTCGFFGRIWVAFKYIFGLKPFNLGQFSSGSLTKETSQELVDYLGKALSSE